jgi:DNA-binding NtrC family response regulator
MNCQRAPIKPPDRGFAKSLEHVGHVTTAIRKSGIFVRTSLRTAHAVVEDRAHREIQMRSTAVWYEIFDVRDRSRVHDHIEALRSEGVDLLPRRQSNHTDPGLVFFESITDDLNEWLHEASCRGNDRVLAVISDGARLDDGACWRLLEAGASDVIAWDQSLGVAGQIAARLDRWTAVDRLLDSPLVRTNLIGNAPVWRAVLRQVIEVAHFTDAPVLILGETGTGKELIARLIHALDARPKKNDLVVLDCTTVVPELAGSEFFGHERGAFTGATGPREGAFGLADGGTLFLDEIGDLQPALQAQLLRAVQERTYKPVGGNAWRSTRFRLVCATHRRLADEVRAGAFRADLYYRIGGVVCHVPALRERPEDILLLFRHFVAQSSDRDVLPDIGEPVRQMLLERSYPGNVRELQQLARRTASRHVGTGPITTGDVPDDERPGTTRTSRQEASLELAIRRELERGAGLKAISRAAAAAAIRVALGDANGNLQLAARRLGVTDRALQMRRASDLKDRRTA